MERVDLPTAAAPPMPVSPPVPISAFVTASRFAVALMVRSSAPVSVVPPATSATVSSSSMVIANEMPRPVLPGGASTTDRLCASPVALDGSSSIAVPPAVEVSWTLVLSEDAKVTKYSVPSVSPPIAVPPPAL